MSNMDKEKRYIQMVPSDHRKAFGQYFTDCRIADFMCSWACKDAKTVLDPAVGNSIFLLYAKKVNPKCALTGYEIDKKILDFFGNPAEANIINSNYLTTDWDQKYDAIICNPPYNRFQTVNNRDEIQEAIYKYTGKRYSSYTNLYALFLIKSIYQLSSKGKLAYVVPSEFMNSEYGAAVKQLMLDRKLLKAVINFTNDGKLFLDATTTCCILLLDHEPKTFVSFFSIESPQDLNEEKFFNGEVQALRVNYENLKAERKWRVYLKQEKNIEYKNLKPVSEYCSVSRGIATGANRFFCFSMSRAREFGIPMDCLEKCICRSSDIKSPILELDDFEALSQEDKTVYLLNVKNTAPYTVIKYIEYGEQEGISKKYLLSNRKPWYSMEQKRTAPIWVSSACRNGMKFVRNVMMAKSLTTFHSIYIHRDYLNDTDLIFCYFLTPTAQSIIRENRKELGNGLEKFQPNDLNNAKMLDVSLVTSQDRKRVLTLYEELKTEPRQELIKELDSLFSAYLLR